ncbi:unnamed protein product, partial [Meganyctiphanes norvegica]
RVGSDHIPIQIELDTKPILLNTNDHLFDYTKANWNSFKEKLLPVIPPVLDKHIPAEIDNSVTQLFEHIQKASEEHIPLKNYKKKKQNFNSPLTVKLIQNYQKYFNNQGPPPPQVLINITLQILFENLIVDKDIYWKKNHQGCI